MLFEYAIQFVPSKSLTPIVGRHFANTGVRHMTGAEQFIVMACAINSKLIRCFVRGRHQMMRERAGTMVSKRPAASQRRIC
ncbi:MAG: hypothetical protein ACRETC_07870 [Gammaproteobacteria bacterium]